MKLKLGIFALVAMGVVALGAYAVPAETAQPVAEAAAPAEEAATEEAVLPWEDPFLHFTSRDGVPHEPTEPMPIGNVWCCKPDGNCGKIKASKCANIGGVQHRTEQACYNDPNC